MSKLLRVLNPAITQYRDRRFEGTEAEWERALATSCTVYVGNLAFTTREEQLYDVFGRVGPIMRIVMGLDKVAKTPCGFAFAIYYTRKDAEEAVAFLNGTLVDERPIRVDIDWGFVEGRQYGRGRSGGQVRDEFRQDYDPGRGGYGKLVQMELIMEQMGSGMDGGMGAMGGGGRGGRGDQRGDFKRQRVFGGGAASMGARGGRGGQGGEDVGHQQERDQGVQQQEQEQQQQQQQEGGEGAGAGGEEQGGAEYGEGAGMGEEAAGFGGEGDYGQGGEEGFEAGGGDADYGDGEGMGDDPGDQQE